MVWCCRLGQGLVWYGVVGSVRVSYGRLEFSMVLSHRLGSGLVWYVRVWYGTSR